MNKTELKKILKHKYNEKVFDIVSKYKYKIIKKNYLKENWGCFSGDEIFFSEFDSAEKFIFAFFHEVAHDLIVNNVYKLYKYDTLLIELECWNKAIKLAMKENITFSDDIIAWGYNQALTYVNHDKREFSKWKEVTTKF